MKKNNITISKVLLYVVAFMWIVIGLNEVIKAFNNEDINAVVIGLFVTVLPFIVYFIIKHRDKKTVDEFEEIKTRQKIVAHMNAERDLISEADTYNQNSFELKNKKENISEKSPTLIKCPVCNKDVSSQAIVCPNCGHPIAEMQDMETEREGVQVDYGNIIDYSKPIKKRKVLNKSNKGCGCAVAIIISIIGLLFAIAVTMEINRGIQSNISGVNDESEYITLSEYNQIQEGMTYDEVCSIVGSSGTEMARSSLAGTTVSIITWYGNGVAGSNANVTFQNEIVTGKAQVGLK